MNCLYCPRFGSAYKDKVRCKSHMIIFAVVCVSSTSKTCALSDRK
jgi:hypothetical protein